MSSYVHPVRKCSSFIVHTAKKKFHLFSFLSISVSQKDVVISKVLKASLDNSANLKHDKWLLIKEFKNESTRTFNMLMITHAFSAETTE